MKVKKWLLAIAAFAVMAMVCAVAAAIIGIIIFLPYLS